MKRKLYVFQWLSNLGGADTRLVDTLTLWSTFMDVTVIPNFEHQLRQKEWTDYLDSLGVKYQSFESLPHKLEGIGISLGNENLFGLKIAEKAKKKGLKIIFSNEMMNLYCGELNALNNELIDCVLYNSPYNKELLEPQYLKSSNKNFKSATIINYVNPDNFPYIERERIPYSGVVVGRVSRASIDKYSEDFPLFYESLPFYKPAYKIMAWNEELKNKYSWFDFNGNWEFYNANQKQTLEFLKELDVFVYKVNHNFKETWGRSVIEAMLTGLPVVVPEGHSFNQFIVDGSTGFRCDINEKYRGVATILNNTNKRLSMGREAARWVRANLCDKEEHINNWKGIFNHV